MSNWKLNRDGSLASFYRYFYGTGDLPKDGCNYFWLTCLAIICTPFVWPAIVLNRLNNKIQLREDEKWIDNNIVRFTYYDVYSSGFISTGLGIVLNLLLLIAGMLIIGPIYRANTEFFMTHVSSIIVSIFLLIAVGAISSTFVYIFFKYLFKLIAHFMPKGPQTPEEWDEYYDKKEKKEAAKRRDYQERKEHPSFFKLIWMRFISYKEKNCPIIEWEETKTIK